MGWFEPPGRLLQEAIVVIVQRKGEPGRVGATPPLTQEGPGILLEELPAGLGGFQDPTSALRCRRRGS